MTTPSDFDDVLRQLPADLADEVRTSAGTPVDRSAATVRAYRADWADFADWCENNGFATLPARPETVALYLADLSGRRKVTTVQRRMSSIAQAHRDAGYESPTGSAVVQTVWAGIRRRRAYAPVPTEPVAAADVTEMVTATPDDPGGLRDRSVLLLGFTGGLRRSELVALDAGDVRTVGEDLVVSVSSGRRAATARYVHVGLGQQVETCPVRTLGRWLEVAGIGDGPVFRPVDRHGRVAESRLSDRAVALIVKRAATRAGLDPQRFSGHSLRAGYVAQRTAHRSRPS